MTAKWHHLLRQRPGLPYLNWTRGSNVSPHHVCICFGYAPRWILVIDSGMRNVLFGLDLTVGTRGWKWNIVRRREGRRMHVQYLSWRLVDYR